VELMLGGSVDVGINALFCRETAVRCQLPDTGWWLSAKLTPEELTS
jgi:hypothetical protein